MKVLIVSFYYHPEIGSGPSRITNMAEGLLKVGAEVEVLAALPNYPKGEIFDDYKGKFYKKDNTSGINVYRYWTYPSISKNPIKRIMSMTAIAVTIWCFAFRIKLIKSYTHVIIQSPPLIGACSAMMLFRGLYRKKTILNVSDLWPLSAVELGAVRKNSFTYNIMLKIEKFLYSHATVIQGQSNEILTHIKTIEPNKKTYLYRNLQHDVDIEGKTSDSRKPFKIVYAGLMGVAQNILGIIKTIDFKRLRAEFHLYGGGNQLPEILEYINNKDIPVFHHGLLNKSQLIKELLNYHASIVPLNVRIYGAVPSKIFDLMPVGIPILYCGEGEAADIVRDYNLGFVSDSQDYNALEKNIKRLVNLDDEDYNRIVQSCKTASKTEFSFNTQINNYYNFLNKM